jgi:hypothetical protein
LLASIPLFFLTQISSLSDDDDPKEIAALVLPSSASTAMEKN